MDEEAQKRNTDCVYFLASPLTCKKGNSCEFRHSKAARLNPRDCWYWVHKTCLNPHCAFRHLPIEGKSVSLPPPQEKGTVTDAPTVPATSVAPLPAMALANKSKTPCYFLSRGNCAKGDNCPYMHDPSMPTRSQQEGASTQQRSKPPPDEASQVSSMPLIVLKGDLKKQAVHESSENRPVSHNEAPPIPPLKSVVTHVKEALQTCKDVERARIPESLATSTAAWHEQVSSGSRKTRISKFSDTPEEYLDTVEKLSGRNGLAERSRKGWKQQQQQQESHQERENSKRSGVLNGTRSEEWRRNEASVLEHEGADQSNQREDGEYSPRFDSKARSRGGPDDSSGSVFKPLLAHQHRDNRHKQHQKPRMHQQLPEYNGIAKHLSRFSSPSHSSGSIRDGERMVPEGYRNTDLRNHLKKRQRDDVRGHPSATHIKERLWQADVPFQEEHNGRETCRREGDYRGLKRQRHDGRSPGPDGRSHRSSPMHHRHALGRSPDRVSHSRSTSGHDYVRGEAIDQGREGYASSRVVLSSHSRSHVVACKGPKSEYVKEDSDFTGPKSLAQIKAEKIGEGSSVKADGNAKVYVPAKARNLADARSWEGKRECSFDGQPAFSKDFGGLKPLKNENWMVEPNVQPQESTADPHKAEDSREDKARDVEDGEVRDEEYDWKEGRRPYKDSPVAPVQGEVASRLPSREAFNHAQEAEDDLGFSEDFSRLDEEMGPALSGEEDYELDEDDEDVAMRLGGFFS